MTSLAKEEEHILQCLGAAVIMQWDDLPTDIQRELFEHAISMGKLHHTAELKGQIARFLHIRATIGSQVRLSLMVRDTNARVIEQMQSLSLNFFIRQIAILTHT